MRIIKGLFLLFVMFYTTTSVYSQKQGNNTHIQSSKMYIYGSVEHPNTWWLKTNCFYGDNNEIISCVFFLPNGQLDHISVYEYDSLISDKLVAYSEFNKLGQKYNEKEKERSDNGITMRIRSNDNLEQDCKNLDKNYETKCKYDNNKNLISFDRRSKTTLFREMYKYEYIYRTTK